MMDDRLLLYLLAGMITLIISARAFVIFLGWRSKYNLATVTVTTIVLIGIILGYFYPGKLDPILINVGNAVRILLVVIFVFLLSVFLEYPNIKKFLNRRKMKNK